MKPTVNRVPPGASSVMTGSAPVSSAGLWNYELHEDYYVLNRGDVQVGILFPDTGMPVGYIRHFVATLNAYYPTEPGTRWPCGKPEASAGPAGLPTERQPEPNGASQTHD